MLQKVMQKISKASVKTKTWLSSRRIVVLLFLLCGLLGLMLVLSMHLSTQRGFEKIYRTSKTYNKLIYQVGYGAAIHHYKNYVLRGDERNYRLAKHEFGLLVSESGKLLAQSDLSADEIVALSYFRDKMQNYVTALSEVRLIIESGERDPLVIDSMTRVDDETAITALASFMETLVDTEYDELTSRRVYFGGGLAFSLLTLIVGCVLAVRLLNRIESSRVETQKSYEKLQISEKEQLRISAALQRANHELEQFAQRVSHDIRAPLRRIKQFSNMVREDIGAERYVDCEPNIDIVIRQTDSLEELAEGLLQLAHSELQEDFNDEAPLAIRAEIDASLLRLSTLIKESNAHIDVQSSVPDVCINKVRLGQVLDNLISNACKYGDPDDAKVWVCAEATADGWQLRVADNGPGVPAEFRDQLFGLFKRFSPGRATGTGLGLSIVKRHAQHLGGDVIYRDTAGGAEFVVQLPCKK